MIFKNILILDTPALQTLAQVAVHDHIVTDYQEHHDCLLDRLAFMISAYGDTHEAACTIIEQYLGAEGLTECSTMGPLAIAENILLTSPGAALLADLRENWVGQLDLPVSHKGNTPEYSITLEQWLETLVTEYTDID